MGLAASRALKSSPDKTAAASTGGAVRSGADAVLSGAKGGDTPVAAAVAGFSLARGFAAVWMAVLSWMARDCDSHITDAKIAAPSNRPTVLASATVVVGQYPDLTGSAFCMCDASAPGSDFKSGPNTSAAALSTVRRSIRAAPFAYAPSKARPHSRLMRRGTPRESL